MENRTRSALSTVSAAQVPFGPMSVIHQRTAAVRALALEIAELTLNSDGIPDAEDCEIAELLFLSKAE
jgi:hypothetical protein